MRHLRSLTLVGLASLAGACAVDDGDANQEDTTAIVSALDLGLPIVSRAAWGAAPANCSSSHSPYRLTVHHTETPNNDSVSAEARVRGIQSYHQGSRGWCDIGYHFLIAPDGRIFEGRPMQKLGSHVGGHNSGNVGIAFLGSFTSMEPSTAQLQAAAQLARAVADTFGFSIDVAALRGHRDYLSTSCPGDALYAHLGQLRADANGQPAASSAWLRGVASSAATADRIANATITLEPGGHMTTARTDGYWEFLAVPFGSYTLTTTAPGFQAKSTLLELAEAERWASMALDPGYAAHAPNAVKWR